ncbi:hypothetical protein DFH06DRAFT_357142 [Mycena polygramma]|nr:hypothetical protein DFH06DRAFT_357142 [Mycena polygramma]
MRFTTTPLLAITLASTLLATATPLVNTSLTERQSCGCTSPSGCPGRCAPLQGSGAFCIGYCGRDNAVACGACGFSTTLGCIVNDDGSCFTVDE